MKMQNAWILILVLIILIILMGTGLYWTFKRRTPNLLMQNDNNYQIYELPHFLTDEECDYLREIAQKKGLFASRVYGNGSDHLDTNVRKSDQAWLNPNEDPKVKAIAERVSHLTGLPISHQEQIQVARYLPGGKFDPHYDACDDNADSCAGMNRSAGPRYITVLVYLNDGYTGGTTSFPKLGKSIQPEKGKAILFYDVDFHTGKILNKSYHAGDPLIDGEKWIMNCWIHLKPFN